MSAETVPTRSLILDAHDELIVPSIRSRLTFDNTVTESGRRYELVEAALQEQHAMPPVLTRRYLGEIAATHAYVLTPWQCKEPARTFAWRRTDIDSVARRIEREAATIDEVDIKIYQKFLDIIRDGSLPIVTDTSTRRPA